MLGYLVQIFYNPVFYFSYPYPENVQFTGQISHFLSFSANILIWNKGIGETWDSSKQLGKAIEMRLHVHHDPYISIYLSAQVNKNLFLDMIMIDDSHNKDKQKKYCPHWH